MKNIYELDFGTIKVFDNLLVSELKEGILFDVESKRQLLEIGSREFQGKPYGYISNRLFSYAVDPMVYREFATYSPLRAIAVVTREGIGWKSAQLEKSFCTDQNRFKIFTSYEKALQWVAATLTD